MDTEKQRQCRRDDARLTESGNARREQLNTRGAYRVANQQSLACLSGSERQRPGWFLDMKHQTCCCAIAPIAVAIKEAGPLVVSVLVVTTKEVDCPQLMSLTL